MLIELVREAAEQAAEQPVVIEPSRVETYGECLRRGEAIARGLRDRHVRRFGCFLRAPSDILAAAVGASLSGSEVCIYPADRDRDGVLSLAHRLSHDVVATDQPFGLPQVEEVSLAELEEVSGPALPAPEQRPVLALTTGTTGEPKGVRHDWVALVEAIGRRDAQPGQRWLLSYNLNQFGGLQMMLHAIANRATLVVPASRGAADVIAAIRENAVTHVSGTPTFWRLIASRLDPDSARALPLQQITLSGEAIAEPILVRLRELFPDARLSQIYAAAEFGTVVSVTDGRSGLPLSVLDKSEDADYRLRIVDGELHVKSRSRMRGYWGDRDEASEWRPSGDLVEVRGDRIHFVGRRSEIINVGGAKVHPLPVEEVASSVPGVSMVMVYGRPNSITGQIVAMDVVPRPDADVAGLEAQLRAACEALPRASRPQRIRFVDELDVRGYKLRRPAPAAP